MMEGEFLIRPVQCGQGVTINYRVKSGGRILAMKRSEAPTQATTRVNLENMTLREEARHERTISGSHLHETSRTGKPTETGSGLGMPGLWEMRGDL